VDYVLAVQKLDLAGAFGFFSSRTTSIRVYSTLGLREGEVLDWHVKLLRLLDVEGYATIERTETDTETRVFQELKSCVYWIGGRGWIVLNPELSRAQILSLRMRVGQGLVRCICS